MYVVEIEYVTNEVDCIYATEVRVNDTHLQLWELEEDEVVRNDFLLEDIKNYSVVECI